mmetsp:Transcript_16472/g.47306  ORF Transcript_16472/g.47306 Transcript_16472/m.47306 type:complete len:136 (+) Transcript_16472:215-622(+)
MSDTDEAASPGRGNREIAGLRSLAKRRHGPPDNADRYSSIDEARTPATAEAKRQQRPGTKTSTIGRRRRIGKAGRSIGTTVARLFGTAQKAPLSQTRGTQGSRNDSPPTEGEVDGEASLAMESDDDDDDEDPFCN